MALTGATKDVELGHIRDGYPALASWIGRDPDNESFVFRKFTRMSARNLLHLQSRLTELERQIDALDKAARHSSDLEAKQSSRRWETLTKYAADDSRGEKIRLQKVFELSEMIKQYHEALVLQNQVFNMERPSNRVASVCREYVTGEASKDTKLPIISGRAKDYLSDAADLVALHKGVEADVLSKALKAHWPIQKRLALDPFDRTTIYSSYHVTWTVSVISLLSATILLIGAIVSLYAVVDPKARLGMIGAYTILFATSIALLTNAKRVEVFGATAAYAAVLVVFVSGNLGGGISSQCLIQVADGIYKNAPCPA
ncbi:hypothetical protein BT63DRAFT_452152 [Microthyrium microscopicum]|uniref:DUF6594 domain-containing protein n=1 Tax=Microthyrium microscopicum TaxID=703497 RepID=A0A6A6UKQ5_9PEZI|nr:hypothetical protein BT63DRAFT_452152 [Microthyrium microscopicum]